MKYCYADNYSFPLPEGHRFPMAKYRLARERLLEEGTLRREQLFDPGPCPRETLALVHSPGYLESMFRGDLSRAEERGLGFPWSPALVRRSQVSVAGTLAAARFALEAGAGGNFAGGTHHAYADRGEGFCLFNDIAVSIRALQAEGRLRRAAIIDCDVHQGNGTAVIFQADPSVFTLSLHAAGNWPFDKEESDLDLALPDGAGDEEYLAALEEGLRAAFASGPEMLFYLAGVDPLRGDRLGRLALSHEGLARRDRRVLEEAQRRDLPVAIAFGGGYAQDMNDIVEAHANTYRIAESLFPG